MRVHVTVPPYSTRYTLARETVLSDGIVPARCWHCVPFASAVLFHFDRICELPAMSDVVLKRGIERVEVDSSQVTTEVLRRTFRVR